jgi:putative pyruvate formate lyase activating enzyme
MSYFRASYIRAYKDGSLKATKEHLLTSLSCCHLCPRDCGVDRLSGETGVCKTAMSAMVASYSPHFGEEAPLVGWHGSGTIFFSHCNLLCNFCQNYDISHEGYGYEADDEQLAGMMLALQRLGCHNINFVTPSHVVPQIISSLEIAIEKGLSVPLVFNTSAYDKVETLRLLDGIFDIYMPDFKFWDSNVSYMTCRVTDYPSIAKQAIKEMQRQVGDLVIDEEGIAEKGLLIRHLVLPGGYSGTRCIMRFIASEISPHAYVNIMPQYYPCGRVGNIKDLERRITQKEYDEANNIAREEGLLRLD